MNKILFAVLSIFTVFLVGCASTSKAGNVPNRVEKNMLMPDGSRADVLFSQKWFGDVHKYANDNNKWKGKDSVLSKSKTEVDLGYGEVWHNEDENESIKKICDIMKESGFRYGVAFINYNKRVRRCCFAYKKNKLKNSFMDFFDESHEFYISYQEKEAAKKRKSSERTEKIVKTLLPTPSVGGSVSSEQELYRLRHKTWELTSIGSVYGSGIKNFKYRHIYRDDGRIINEYIVDLDGNIRSNIMVHDRNHDFNKMYPLVEYYSVPKEIRDLAQKSLD